jgi:hypothetical protein
VPETNLAFNAMVSMLFDQNSGAELNRCRHSDITGESRSRWSVYCAEHHFYQTLLMDKKPKTAGREKEEDRILTGCG